jgi:hypothetical protein
MDTTTVEQQKGAESPTNTTTLSAQQFYQHDPLLVLLKDKLRLHDLWIIVGAMLFPFLFRIYLLVPSSITGLFNTLRPTWSEAVITRKVARFCIHLLRSKSGFNPALAQHGCV